MGCGASSGRGAEELTKGHASMEMYFQELKKFTDEEMKDLEEMEKLKKKGDARAIVDKQNTLKANRGAFKVIADRLLKECFEAGDASGDGFLSKEESAKVFADIVDEKGDYLSIMAKEEQRRTLATELGMSKRMFAAYDVPNEEAVRKQLEDESKAEAKRSMAEIDKAMQEALADYKARKKQCDEAAFGVLDTGKDGKINKKEFVAAFDTTSDTYEKFLTALGLFEAPAKGAPKVEPPKQEAAKGDAQEPAKQEAPKADAPKPA